MWAEAMRIAKEYAPGQIDTLQVITSTFLPRTSEMNQWMNNNKSIAE